MISGRPLQVKHPGRPSSEVCPLSIASTSHKRHEREFRRTSRRRRLHSQPRLLQLVLLAESASVAGQNGGRPEQRGVLTRYRTQPGSPWRPRLVEPDPPRRPCCWAERELLLMAVPSVFRAERRPPEERRSGKRLHQSAEGGDCFYFLSPTPPPIFLPLTPFPSVCLQALNKSKKAQVSSDRRRLITQEARDSGVFLTCVGCCRRWKPC